MTRQECAQAPAGAARHPDPTPRPAGAPGGPWQAWEDEIVRRHYPTGQTAAVIAAGVTRSPNAITWRANHVLGVGNQPHARPRTRARLTSGQRQHLTRLAALDGLLLDQDDASVSILTALARKRLAKHEGAGLWRITLAGLIEHRKGNE